MLPAMNAPPPAGYGPPPTPPSPGRPVHSGPSRGWYVLVAVVLVLGLAGGGTLITLGVTSLPAPTATVPSSGEPEPVQFDEPGLTIFIDRTGVGGRCRVLDENDERIALAPVKGSESIDVNGHHWYVVLRTPGEVPAGTYRVSCRSEASHARFAVGPHQSVLGSLGTLFAGLGSAFVGVLVAFVVWLVTFLRRRSARRHAQRASPSGRSPQYPGGPAPPGWQSPPGQ